MQPIVILRLILSKNQLRIMNYEWPNSIVMLKVVLHPLNNICRIIRYIPHCISGWHCIQPSFHSHPTLPVEHIPPINPLNSSSMPTEQVTEQVWKLISVMDKEHSTSELMELLNLRQREHFRKEYLQKNYWSWLSWTNNTWQTYK